MICIVLLTLSYTSGGWGQNLIGAARSRVGAPSGRSTPSSTSSSSPIFASRILPSYSS